MLFYSSSQNPKKIYHGTTVLNNDKKCLISKSEWFLKNHVTRKIRVMVLKKALHHRNTLHFKILKQKTVILNILLFWLYPINVALVSRRDFFNLTDPKPLKRSVFIIKQRSSSQSISETHYTRCDCLRKALTYGNDLYAGILHPVGCSNGIILRFPISQQQQELWGVGSRPHLLLQVVLKSMYESLTWNINMLKMNCWTTLMCDVCRITIIRQNKISKNLCI